MNENDGYTINRITGDVTLTREKLYKLMWPALLRQLDHSHKKTPITSGLNSKANLGLNIDALWTEYVLVIWLAKWVQFEFKEKGSMDKTQADVGDIHEARSTHHDSGNLILRPRDMDDHVYWLITGEYGNYRVRGWMWGHEAKQPEFMTEDKTGKGLPAYYSVPQHKLHSRENTSWMKPSQMPLLVA